MLHELPRKRAATTACNEYGLWETKEAKGSMEWKPRKTKGPKGKPKEAQDAKATEEAEETDESKGREGKPKAVLNSYGALRMHLRA